MVILITKNKERNRGVQIQKKDKDMNKILNTVFINTDYQKRNYPDKSQ